MNQAYRSSRSVSDSYTNSFISIFESLSLSHRITHVSTKVNLYFLMLASCILTFYCLDNYYLPISINCLPVCLSVFKEKMSHIKGWLGTLFVDKSVGLNESVPHRYKCLDSLSLVRCSVGVSWVPCAR